MGLETEREANFGSGVCVRRTSLVDLMKVKMGEGVVLGEGERGVEGDARVEWDVKI
jgi:hypothetical protein